MVSRSQDDEDIKIYDVADSIHHPYYGSFNKSADIALIKLKENVKFSEKIHPICLPTKQHEDRKAIVSGFGKTGENSPMSDNLMKATLEGYNHSYCQEFYDHNKIYENTMLCFGNSDSTRMIDSCNVSEICFPKFFMKQQN